MEANGSDAVGQAVAKGVVPEAPSTEVIEKTVVEAEPEKSELAVAAVPEAPKPIRKCSKCGHESGNGTGKIRLGRIVEEKSKDGTKRYVIAALCDGCVEAEKALSPKEGGPFFKIGFLISQVGEMNKQAAAFNLAKGYWERVSRGIETPEVRKTPEGKLACGVPDCWRCKDGLAAVEHFLVLKKDGMSVIVGICVGQAAALAKCEADQKFFVTKNFGEAKRQVEAEAKRIAAFEAAKRFWAEVDAGEAVVEVRVEETGTDDIYRCSVPNCKCREHGDKPVEHFVVLDSQYQMPIVGICRFQFAALKQSGVKLFTSSNGDGLGLVRCEKHRRWLLNKADGAARAVQGRPPRPPRPQDFDKIGGGLSRFRSQEAAAQTREKKQATRELREKKRHERSLKDKARFLDISKLPRPGEQLGRGKGGNKKR